MRVEIREAEDLHEIDDFALVVAQRVAKLLIAGVLADLIDLRRHEQLVAEFRHRDDAAEAGIVRRVARPRVDELAAVRDERAQHACERLRAVLRDLLDDLARAQTDDGQHLARARDRPLRDAVLRQRHRASGAGQRGSRRGRARARDELAPCRGCMVCHRGSPTNGNQCVIACTRKFVPMRNASVDGRSGYCGLPYHSQKFARSLLWHATIAMCPAEFTRP